MKIVCDKFLSDDEVKNLKGTLLNESHIKYPVVKVSCDCYSNSGDLLFKFRKKIIPPEVAKESFLAFKDLAAVSRGRGASAGPIESDSKYWSKREPVKTRTFSTKYITPEGKESKMRVNNPVFGGIIGYYEPTKSFGNLPCRLTSFTINHLKDFKIGCKYSRAIAKSYKELNAPQYEKQLERADKLPHLKIEDTPFSTITVNRNFQTAVHTDAGDFGFGNMGVLEYGHYHGGEFVLPQYGIAVDVRDGDHLCANVHKFHGNLPMFETEEDKAKNDLLPHMFKDNVEVGVKGAGLKYARISLVHYLREKLYEMCPNAPYDPKSLDRVSLNKNKINYQYVINLEKDKDRFEKFKWSEWKRWNATHWKDMGYADPLFKKMVSYWNVPENQHKAKCGCFQSHLSLLKWIVIHELENVLICEDDALLVGDLPKKFPKDGITYLGGFIRNKKITSQNKIEINHSIGLNELDKSKYRMMMTMAYIVPHWKIAENIIDLIESKERVRAIDIELNNCSDKSYYIYPAPFIEEDIPSTIRKGKQKHSTTEFTWV